jgi:hypothetical protein
MAGLWVLAYAAQIGFGMFVLATCPKRPDLPARVQTARGYAIWAGFVPFILIMLVVQLICFGWYKSAADRAATSRARLQAALPTSFGSSGAPAAPAVDPAVPPAVAPAVAPVNPARSNNPFL